MNDLRNNDDSTPAAQARRQIRLGIYGYGEVGHGLALGLGKLGLQSITAYQRNADSPLCQERARASKVRLVASPTELAHSADVIIAVTQGTESVNAARSVSETLGPQHCYVDLASASPGAKRQVAEVLAASGALYADGAIEGSPLVHEHRFPVIISGPGAGAFSDLLTPWGMRIAIVGNEVGKATAIKGLRHILMKGQMALLIECAIAAKRYGVSEEVFASVAEWYDSLPFLDSARRLMCTTTVHAERRSEEAAIGMALLEELGVEPIMTRGTVELLTRIADLNLREQLGASPPKSHDTAIELMEAYLRK